MVDRLLKALRLAMAGGCVALAGCAGNSPFDRGPSDAFATANGFDDPNRRPYDQLAQAFPQENVQAPGATPGQPSGNRFIGSMQRLASSFGDAVTPEPQVHPAEDPTSLTSGNQNAGADLNYHAARVYESRNKPHEAAALYEKSLHMDPNHVRTLIAYARLLDREGSFARAETLYRHAIEVQPGNPVAVNDLGMMYARQGMFQPAIESIGRAIEQQPTNQRYRNNIAIVLLDAGRIDEAFSHLATVHGEANAHYNLAFLLSQRQMQAEAIQHLDRALVLSPQHDAARQLAQQLAPVQQPESPTGQQYIPVSAPLPNGTLPIGSNRTPPLPPL